MDILVGFILGLISSGIITIIWYKVFIPNLLFAQHICKYDESTDNNEPYTYKVKIRNSGRRDIFEMRIYCTLVLPDFQMEGSIHTANINMSYDFCPLFKKRVHRKGVNPDALIKFRLNDIDIINELSRPIYSTEINQIALNKNITLNALLSICKDAHLKIYVIAHDRFTGSKKIFESHKYMYENIKEGIYRLGGLDIWEK